MEDHLTTATTIAYTARPGAVFGAEFSGAARTFAVRTSASLFSFGVFAQHGITLPPGSHQWRATSREPFVVDEDLTVDRTTPGALSMTPAPRTLIVD